MRIGGRQLWSQGKARLLLLELTSRSGDFLWTVDDGRLKVIENTLSQKFQTGFIYVLGFQISLVPICWWCLITEWQEMNSRSNYSDTRKDDMSGP